MIKYKITFNYSKKKVKVAVDYYYKYAPYVGYVCPHRFALAAILTSGQYCAKDSRYFS